MVATERLLQIEERFGADGDRIVVLALDGETVRLVRLLNDGINLRLAEQWSGDTLERYSSYWLTASNELKIGWDHAPHHTHPETFPHHRHVARQENLQPSFETSLEDVMALICTLDQ